METDPVAAVFALCEACGLKDMKSHPGLVHIPVDENWEIWINPHKGEPIERKGSTLEPFHVLVEWNGWPASVFHPMQKEIVFAAGKCANLDAFLQAVEKARLKELDSG